MKKKVLLIIFIGIIMYSCFLNTTCYADDFSFVMPEASGWVEPVVTPDPPADAPGGDPVPPGDTPTEEPGPEIVTIPVPVAIEGEVWEDFERVEKVADGSMDGTKQITNNQKKDSDEPGIAGINVAGTTTDSSGHFSITTPGTYDMIFTYGQGTDPNDYKLNKNTLKYNAQDYNMEVSGGSSADFDLTYIRKIKEMKKSYTEIYIVIDHSNSMRIEPNPRIDIVKNAAKNFVNALFENAKGNLAVGYIAFGYESVIIKKPTNVKDDVINAIENFKVEEGVGMYSGQSAPMFSSLNKNVGTNIGGAVLKAKDSYVSSESNQVMVLFSDGAATAHEGVDPIYTIDSNAAIASKLEQVSAKTKEDLKVVRDSGITLISILNYTEGTEKKYVDKSFKDGDEWIGSYYEVDYSNLDAVNEALLNDTKTIIEKTKTENVNYTETKEYIGSDDPERRSVVSEYYKDFYYDKLKIFSVVNKLNGTKENDSKVIANISGDRSIFSSDETKYKKFIKKGMTDSDSDLGKFLDKSWMKTTSNSVSIESLPSPSTVYEYDEDGEVSKITYYVPYTIYVNAYLVKRDDFNLNLDKKVTGVRLTLNDGTVLYNMLSENAAETVAKNKEFKELYCNQLKKSKGLIDEIDMIVHGLSIKEVENIPDAVYLTVDTDILQGATLEVEYTLTIRNDSRSGVFSEGFSIVDYFDKSLLYRPENKLLTEDGTNADYNWQILDQDYLHEDLKYLSDDVVKLGSGYKQCLYIDYNKGVYEKAEGIPEDGDITDFGTKSKYVNPVIGSSGERYVKVVLSRVLTPESVDDFCFRNQAEILKYKDNDSRRANYVEIEGIDAGKYKYPISGNYIPTDVLGALDDKITNKNEVDTAVANKIGIIPPTGRKTFWNFSFFKNLVK